MGYTHTNRRLTYGADSPSLSILVSQLQTLMGFTEALEYIGKYPTYQARVYAAQLKLKNLREQAKNAEVKA